MTSDDPVRSLEDLVTIRLAERGQPGFRGMRRMRSEYSTSAPIDEVTVELHDGSRLELMAKKLGAAALLDGARHAKPAFACSPTREPLVYACLEDEVGPPRCWGVVVEPDGPLLVLERVPGLALRHLGDLSLWQEAAAWLAGFHGRWPGPSGEMSTSLEGQLLVYDQFHHERLLQRAVAFARAAGHEVPPGVIEQHGNAIEILGRLPTTLVHGEFYASNIIVDPSVSPLRVAVFDWEMAGTGSPFLDLAALVSGEWELGDRRAIVDVYRHASVLDLSARDFDQALVAAELLISTQWMGWANGWLPPDDQSGDWAGNAGAMAEILRSTGGRGDEQPCRVQSRGAEPSHAGRAAGRTRAMIVNADDLGLSAGVNRGIFDSFDHGIVTSASLMVREVAAGDAAAGAAVRPELALGLHVDLGEWQFRNGAWEAAYEIVDGLDADAVEIEVAAQLTMFRALVGRDPTHLDSHQHVHRQQPVVAAVLSRLAEVLAVPLRGAGAIAYCGEFYGQLPKGEPYPEAITVGNLVQLIDRLPAGITELGCHPGYADAAKSVYCGERFLELNVLCDPLVSQAVSLAGVQLLSFADVSPG